MKISHLTVTLGLLSLVACSADATPSEPASTAVPTPHSDATTPTTPTTGTAAPSTTSGTTTATTDATTVPAPAPAPVPAPEDDVCLGVLSGGGSFSTKGIDHDGCAAECNQNAALNPNVTITCTWNGAPVAITSIGTCKGEIGGGSFSTAGISRDGCAEECRGNANLNPGANVTCSWNGAPIAF